MIKRITAMNMSFRVLLGVILVCAAVVASAQPSQKQTVESVDSSTQSVTLQTFALMTEKGLNSDVLVSAEDADTLVRIRKDIKELDYPSLLAQLKQNGFTAYKSNGDIHFIQTRYARHSPIPVVEKNKTYFDDEHVTDYIKLEKACSYGVLQTLRPLVPQDSHLASSQNPEMLLISDTYANIQRIKTVIQQIEDEMEKPADCTNVKPK